MSGIVEKATEEDESFLLSLAQDLKKQPKIAAFGALTFDRPYGVSKRSERAGEVQAAERTRAFC